MIDSPPVDNLNRPDVSTKNNFSPLPNMDRPGRRSGSTPLDREKMGELQKQESPGDELIMKALQQSIKDQKQKKEQPVQELMEKQFEPKKTVIIDTPKNNPDVQQGFLMPFVDGLNGVINNIWNALKSLVPMKPQTGAS